MRSRIGTKLAAVCVAGAASATLATAATPAAAPAVILSPTATASPYCRVPNRPFDVLQPGQSAAVGQLILTGGTVVLPIGEVSCTPV